MIWGDGATIGVPAVAVDLGKEWFLVFKCPVIPT